MDECTADGFDQTYDPNSVELHVVLMHGFERWKVGSRQTLDG